MKTIDWLRFVKWLKENHDFEDISFNKDGIAHVDNNPYSTDGTFFIVTDEILNLINKDLKENKKTNAHLIKLTDNRYKLDFSKSLFGYIPRVSEIKNLKEILSINERVWAVSDDGNKFVIYDFRNEIIIEEPDDYWETEYCKVILFFD